MRVRGARSELWDTLAILIEALATLGASVHGYFGKRAGRRSVCLGARSKESDLRQTAKGKVTQKRPTPRKAEKAKGARRGPGVRGTRRNTEATQGIKELPG